MQSLMFKSFRIVVLTFTIFPGSVDNVGDVTVPFIRDLIQWIKFSISALAFSAIIRIMVSDGPHHCGRAIQTVDCNMYEAGTK